MKTYLITPILSLCFLFFGVKNIYGQTITNDAQNYLTICTGRILNIPVTLTGTFSNNNSFVLKLTEYSWSGDTTISITALNNTSPLQFQLPNIFASRKKSSGYFFKYTISSTSPIVVSAEKTLTMNILPMVQLGNPLQYVSDYMSGHYVINDYCSIDRYREITYLLAAGNTDNNTSFQTNTNSTIYSNYSGQFSVNPLQTTTYQVSRVWNNCGNGQVLQPNSVTIKKNPFKIKITDIFPTSICEDKKINVSFDYLGNFNASNQFIIEIANYEGNKIWQLQTSQLNNNQLTATISDTLASGKYHVRVRATDPDLATDYLPIRVLQKPNIALQWISGANNPINYKNEVWLRIYSYGSDDLNYPTFMKFSDGTTVNYFGGVSGGRMADVNIKPLKSVFFKLDSLVTTCGVSKSYTITGERDLIINKNFYVEDLPKNDYCTGEKVKFKINSSYQFSPQNNFTAKLFIQSRDTLSLPVIYTNDGNYEFTMPNDSIFEYSFWQLTFRIHASDPQVFSAIYNNVVKVYGQPSIRVTSPNTVISSPSKVYYPVQMKIGLPPTTIVINNGSEDFISQINGSANNFETSSSVEVPVFKNTNFKIKSISNTCGSKNYSPSRDFSVSITNPLQRVIYLKKSPKNICLGGSFQLEIDTSGVFQSNDEFVVKLQYSSYSYEVGRGTGKIINIQIPANIPVVDGLNQCSFLVSSRLTENDNLPYLLRYGYAYITSKQVVNFGYINVSNQAQSYSVKEITILKGEAITVRIDAPNTIPKDAFQVKINNQWFYNNFQNDSFLYNAQPFLKTFQPLRDTTLILQGMIYRCGQYIQKDTIRVFVKKNRIQTRVIQSGTRCQNSLIDVYPHVEGDTSNLPQNYKFYFIPAFDNTKRFEAQIISKISLKYTLKIPDMPYENSFQIEVVPTTNQNDFITNYRQEQIFINRKPNVKFTGMDGSQIAWTDGRSSAVAVKIESLNSNNPSWQGKIVSDFPNTYYSSDVANYGAKSYRTSIYSFSLGDVFSLKNVENTCGFGTSTGQVKVVFCHKDLILPVYYNYSYDKEYHSSTFIKSADSYNPNTSVLYSSKEFTELLPGFKTRSNLQLFDIQVSGCKVIP